MGIVTVDDAIDVMQEEATEDISKMAAITPADKPYLRLSVFELWRSHSLASHINGIGNFHGPDYHPL